MYLKELITKDKKNYVTDDKLDKLDMNLFILISRHNQNRHYSDKDGEILMNYLDSVRNDLIKNVLIHEKNQSILNLCDALTYMYIEVMNGVHVDKDIFINEIEISQ